MAIGRLLKITLSSNCITNHKSGAESLAGLAPPDFQPPICGETHMIAQLASMVYDIDVATVQSPLILLPKLQHKGDSGSNNSLPQQCEASMRDTEDARRETKITPADWQCLPVGAGH